MPHKLTQRSAWPTSNSSNIYTHPNIPTHLFLSNRRTQGASIEAQQASSLCKPAMPQADRRPSR